MCLNTTKRRVDSPPSTCSRLSQRGRQKKTISDGGSNQKLILFIRGNAIFFLFFFFFFNLTCSRWTSSLPSRLWSLRIIPSLPGSRLTILLSRCKFSNLRTRQPMVEFYLLTFPRCPLRKKEHKSYFGKNRTHDFRTSRCAGYLLNHSGDEGYQEHQSLKVQTNYQNLLSKQA